jgi:formyltetrahydrofolate-dependent phosphoribosylglycinamide formyltransferase
MASCWNDAAMSRRIGVLISGRGSNLQALSDAQAKGMLGGEIAVVISNVEDAHGLTRARAAGVPAVFRDHRGLAREAFDVELQRLLEHHGVDLICLAGFMRLLSPAFVRAHAGRIVNVHPSLLPAFPGKDAQRQALEHGVKVSGATVHLVDEGLDSGPIVMQEAVACTGRRRRRIVERAHPGGGASHLPARGCGAARRALSRRRPSPRLRAARGEVTMRGPAEAFDYLTKGCVDVVTPESLKAKLARGKPLTVKVGFDPTAPDLHLGHTVLIRKMKHFQDLGHHVIFVIGDFTGMIGDPTGRSKTRPALTREEIEANAETYKRQVFKILDSEKTEIRFNREWLGALGSDGMVRLAATYNVARMLERRHFRERYEAGPVDLDPRVPLPACTGVRLRRLEGGRRARRDGPALQPERGPRHHAGVRSRAAGRDDDPAARGH